MVLGSESSPERKIKRPCSTRSQTIGVKHLIEKNNSDKKSDLDSKSAISVEGHEELKDASNDSLATATVKKEVEETPANKFTPFSEKRRTSLIREVLRLSAEEFIRIYVHLQKIPVVNLFTLFKTDTPDALFTYKEANLIRILRLTIHKVKGTRPKLLQYNTIDDCVSLIEGAKKILVLTGAGVSVSCGIPDFRSENGIYARLEEFNLSNPHQMFSLDHFQHDPKCFYSFAKEIYPSKFQPSPSHKFIKLLEARGKLLRNYTQNIDTLEQAAGITRVIQCHGSFATASCIRCRYTFPGKFVEDNIINQTVPSCPRCKDGIFDQADEVSPGIIKPDIVFFGEALPEEYGARLKEDKTDADLLIVMGTSLVVQPVSQIASILPHHVPSIFINRTPNTSIDFDIQLLGFSDVIVSELNAKLGWNLPSCTDSSDSPNKPEWDTLCKPPHWHIFSGAQTEGLIGRKP